MRKGESKKGFTIIEVVLVLAIAGLIFLMVFIALPSLQRNQRDAKRRDDMAVLLDAIKKYQTNNRGALPASNVPATFLRVYYTPDGTSPWYVFYRQYLGDNFKDPDGTAYDLYVTSCDGSGTKTAGQSCWAHDDSSYNILSKSFPNDHRIYITTQATCDGETAVKSSNPRKVTLQYKLEGGGVACLNS